MKLSDCFVMEAFNELINFPFEDVRAAFNQFDCYVAMGKEESFVKEVVHISIFSINKKRIIIHERTAKHSKTATQQIDIYFRYIGKLAPEQVA